MLFELSECLRNGLEWKKTVRVPILMGREEEGEEGEEDRVGDTLHTSAFHTTAENDNADDQLRPEEGSAYGRMPASGSALSTLNECGPHVSHLEPSSLPLGCLPLPMSPRKGDGFRMPSHAGDAARGHHSLEKEDGNSSASLALNPSEGGQGLAGSPSLPSLADLIGASGEHPHCYTMKSNHLYQ